MHVTLLDEIFFLAKIISLYSVRLQGQFNSSVKGLALFQISCVLGIMMQINLLCLMWHRISSFVLKNL